MNLREFCQIPKLTSALLTTYNFDPLFFERVVLTDLAQGGTTKIVILADADQALDAVARAKGQLLALGRRYRLIPVRTKGAFHPKVCVRVGAEGAAVACGSHNLTRAGWLGCRKDGESGGNRELTVAWQALVGTPTAAYLAGVVGELSAIAENAVDREDILSVIPPSWRDARIAGSEPWSWVLTGRERTLADVVASRWKGRRFERVRVVCGSTDDRGAMLRWAADTFGVKDAVVEVDLTCCGFDPRRLADLPLRLQLVPYDGRPRSHLKAVLFESSEGCAAVVGSANCSGAAWLRKSSESGNIESVIIYDHCAETHLSHLFRAGHPDPKPWDQVGLTAPVEIVGEVRKAADHSLRQLQLHRAAGELIVTLASNAEPDVKLSAVIQTNRVPLRPTADRGCYVGPMPDLIEGPESLFGHVEWEWLGKVERTNEIWIDDVDRLLEAAGRQYRFDSVKRLASTGSSAACKQMLEDIHVLTQTLLFSPDAFPDGTKRSQKVRDANETQPAQPVTPADVIHKLDQLSSTQQHGPTASAYSSAISLTGIMQLLFAEGEVGADIDPTAAEHQRSDEEEEQEQSRPDDATATSVDAGPTLAQRKRLIGELQKFLDHLAKPSFAAKCSARQLQQAAAFPPAIARFASKGPWVEDAERGALSSAVQRTCELLFFRNHLQLDPETKQNRRCRPLMEEVRERYEAESREADFDQIVGDGTLWLVLLGSLSVFSGGVHQRFARNLILRDIAQYPALSIAVVPEQLSALARRIDWGGAASPVDEAKLAFERVTALEEHLDTNFDDLKAKCAPAAKVGDWLWNRGVRFAQVIELLDGGKAKVHVRKRAETLNNVMLSFYVNMRVAGDHDETLRKLVVACESTTA